MGYGVMHFFPGGTRANYEASVAAVHPAKGKLPAGQIFHAAGPTAGGYLVVAVHENQESWERFRDQVLMPRLQQGIKGGFPSPPRETVFEVEHLQMMQAVHG